MIPIDPSNNWHCVLEVWTCSLHQPRLQCFRIQFGGLGHLTPVHVLNGGSVANKLFLRSITIHCKDRRGSLPANKLACLFKLLSDTGMLQIVKALISIDDNPNS